MRGLLVVDDTQALGVLGAWPSSGVPYGFGGGGTPRWSGVFGPRLVTISSLAKGFGAPLAVLSGSRSLVRRFENRSETRVHCSPPSAAAIRAAQAALAVNRESGDSRRAHLHSLVRRFRKGARAAGLVSTGGSFPAQSLRFPSAHNALAWHQHLLETGIRTVLQGGYGAAKAGIGFLFNANHRRANIEIVCGALRRLSRVPPGKPHQASEPVNAISTGREMP